AEEQAELREELARQVEQRQQQIDALLRQVGALETELREREGAAGEIESLRALVAQLESERASGQRRLDAMPVYRSAGASTESRPEAAFDAREPVRYRRRSFGRFYALVIGVQDYDHLDPLASPANDAERVRSVLEDKYGFSVITLVDPDQIAVMRAVNQLNETVTDDDNLLIYFAGHGSRLSSGNRETGYWLPVNAEPPPDDTLWVPNDFVTRHLGRIEAKRVLVVSDSCYAGLLGDDPGYVMVGDGQYTDEYIEWKMPKRSRLVLASGGDSPVLDGGGDGHSVFARAFIEELESNASVMTAPELFLRVRERFESSEAAAEIGQEPQLKVIKDAGHEVGDFFFVPG